MHDLLRICDLDAEELATLLDLALRLKGDRSSLREAGRGRTAGVLFEKPSLRTKFSVETALIRIGAHPVGAYDTELGLGTREPMGDAGRVLARYVDAIVMRTFGHERLEALADAADVPVVNALSDTHHPLQALADLMTLVEALGEGDTRALKDMRLAYLGDGNNVANSLIEACGLAGAEIAVACPKGFEPDRGVIERARATGARVELTPEPEAAVRDASAVYTDVWASMGQEAEAEDRRRVFAPYRVTEGLMDAARPGAVFLHCLPAHRGEEVAAAVIDGPASRVLDQAENRLHTAAAVFATLFEEG